MTITYKDISIIIPAYNSGEFIGKAIDSIIKTELQVDYEIIIVDDGSTDNTANNIRSYIKDNVKYIYQNNAGVSAARNTGLEHAVGKYIMFLDADDTYNPLLLSEIGKVIQSKKEIYVFSYRRTKETEPQSISIKPKEYSDCIYKHTPSVFINDYISGVLLDRVHVCSCIFLKTILINNNIEFDRNILFGEDQLFLINALMHSNKLEINLSNQLLNYFVNINSATQRFNIRRLDVIRMLDSIILKKYSHNIEIINSRVNKELVNIATLYIKNNSLLSSFRFISSDILPRIRNDNINIELYVLKDKMFLFSPYIYMVLYKFYSKIR